MDFLSQNLTFNSIAFLLPPFDKINSLNKEAVFGLKDSDAYLWIYSRMISRICREKGNAMCSKEIINNPYELLK